MRKLSYRQAEPEDKTGEIIQFSADFHKGGTGSRRGDAPSHNVTLCHAGEAPRLPDIWNLWPGAPAASRTGFHSFILFILLTQVKPHLGGRRAASESSWIFLVLLLIIAGAGLG